MSQLVGTLDRQALSATLNLSVRGGHTCAGLRSSTRSGGLKPYRAGSYRRIRQSPGLADFGQMVA